MNLFGEHKPEIIRTLGLYQPFASLMRPPYYKKETRWVRKGKQPPFPKGRYLLYSTQKQCKREDLFEWCGPALLLVIKDTLINEPTKDLNGYALAIADLKEPHPMRSSDEWRSFVKYRGEQERTDRFNRKWIYIQWCLPFVNVSRIEPFEFKFGKQGVGILPPSEHSKIKIICNTPT